MNNTENISYFANGEPATFATKREKPWKKNLIQQIPDETIKVFIADL